MSLTYMASEKVIPGYGGGMSSAKAALESDTRVLAFEAGRKYGVISVFIQYVISERIVRSII